MPQQYKLFTALTAIAGSFSLVITGELNPIYYPFILIMLYGYWRLLKGLPQASRSVIGASSIMGVLIFLFDSFLITGDYLTSVGHLSLIFHAIKSFDIKEPYDPLQVYFMALLQLVVASEFTVAMLFGVIIILFIILFIIVMNMAHYVKYSSPAIQQGLGLRTGSLTILVLFTILISAIFFISLPRLTAGLWGKSHIKGIRNAGFSEKMDLSGGEIKLDKTVVARIELRPFIKGPYYWKGMVLDYYDGRQWINSQMQNRRILRKTATSQDGFIIDESPGGYSSFVEQEILLEPIESDIIFAMDRRISIFTSFTRVEKDPHNSLYLPGRGARRIHYTVRSIPEEDLKNTLNPRLRDLYLRIPDSIRDTIKEISEKIMKEELKGGASPPALDRAIAIERYLKKNYRYSLEVKPPPYETDPVLYFLLESKAGYCEHYASAMALLLRAEGIPSRVVTGFYGGEVNPVGNYIILRQKDAHSWVEAFIEDRWLRFDPTPAVIQKEERPPLFILYIDFLKMKWQRYIVNFSREDQIGILRSLKFHGLKLGSGLSRFPFKRDLPAILLTVIVIFSVLMIILFFLLISVRRAGGGEISLYYIRFLKELQRRGLKIQSSITPGEVMKMLQSSPGGEVTVASGEVTVASGEVTVRGDLRIIEEFINMYQEARFGARAIDMNRYRELFKLSRESLR